MREDRFPGGVWPVMLTPFTEENTIDYEALSALIEWYIGQGAEGLFAVTQSSEMFFLTRKERIELTAFVKRQAAGRVPVIASGHISDSLEDQAEEIRQIAGAGADAVILVTNRLARQDEPDSLWLWRLSELLDRIPEDIRLGLYECPYPYKRQMSEEMTEWCARSGRFYFLKDTCCDLTQIRRKLSICRGTNLKLYNANTATLLPSLRAGAAGYSGVMANMQCTLYAWLCRHASDEGRRQQADKLSEELTMCALIERQWYPANAKYYLTLEGLPLRVKCRGQEAGGLTETYKNEMHMLRHITARLQEEVAGAGRTAAQESLPQSGGNASEKNEQKADPVGGKAEAGRPLTYQVLEHQHIFRSETYFRQCHASTICRLSDGSLVCAWFGGEHEKAPDVGIWLSRRVDGVWREPVKVADREEIPCWNPVLFDRKDRLLLFYKIGKEIPKWQTFVKESFDGGLTWSEERELAAGDFGGRGPVKNKCILLRDGAILAPASTEEGGWNCFADRSEDGGRTWIRSGDVPVRREAFTGTGLIQPTLWEDESGDVHMLMRSSEGVLFQSDSCDGGRTWCQARPTALANNNCGVDLARLADGRLVLVYNPVSGNWAARSPIAFSVSCDNGASWSEPQILDHVPCDRNREDAEFSYPAVIADGEEVYITYTWKRRTIAFWHILFPEE